VASPRDIQVSAQVETLRSALVEFFGHRLHRPSGLENW
jgi:hypothetical protein